MTPKGAQIEEFVFWIYAPGESTSQLEKRWRNFEGPILRRAQELVGSSQAERTLLVMNRRTGSQTSFGMYLPGTVTRSFRNMGLHQTHRCDVRLVDGLVKSTLLVETPTEIPNRLGMWLSWDSSIDEQLLEQNSVCLISSICQQPYR
jgi:hypothetical protein